MCNLRIARPRASCLELTETFNRNTLLIEAVGLSNRKLELPHFPVYRSPFHQFLKNRVSVESKQQNG